MGSYLDRVLVVFHLKKKIAFLTSFLEYSTVRRLFSSMETWGISSVRDSFIEKFPSSGDPNNFL
jgi:hypothetical protein